MNNKLVLLMVCSMAAGCAGTLEPFARSVIDWTDVPELTAADKADITQLAQNWYMGGPAKASVVHHFPGPERSYAISSEVFVNGLRRTWRDMYVCHAGEGYCRTPPRDSAGEWSVGKEPLLEERWRIADGDWFVDVELGSGISYAEAEMIVLAIRHNTLVITPEVAKYRQGFNASSIYAINTRDPIAREFQVELGGDSSGESLSVRLQDGEVQVYEFGIWQA